MTTEREVNDLWTTLTLDAKVSRQDYERRRARLATVIQGWLDYSYPPAEKDLRPFSVDLASEILARVKAWF